MKLSDAHDWTALHIASLSNPPLYLIYALLIVFPEGAKERDSAGRLPLHLAAGSETRVSVLNTLVRFNNDGISTRDDRGFIPLHLALLRDGTEEISIETIRILLGQNIANGDTQIKWGENYSPRALRDGYMRNKGHLNLGHTEIHRGVLGESRNSAILKERKRKEELLRFAANGAEASLSRGFARNINEADSQDGEPYMHEHLASLWLEDNQNINDPFHLIEISEAKFFSSDIQNCLKQLTLWKKKFDKEHHCNEGELKSIEGIINPATIPAPPHFRLPIHMAVRRNHKRNIANEVINNSSTLDVPSNQNEILRILIHAHPSSLVVKDLQNKTPLMTCLSMIHHKAIHPVDLDMINLLLGTQSFGFDFAPQWLEDDTFFREHQKLISQGTDLTQHKIGGIIRNAAMVPCDETFPLHIAARECLSTEIVHAIYSCYPGAKYAQDDRGCTPLHLTLQNLTGKTTVNLDVLWMLMDEKVLRIQNYMDQSLYELLVANARAHKLPKMCKPSEQRIQSTHTFKPFFHQAVSERLIDISGTYHKNSLFTDLCAFPSWVRKQACATPSFQDLLLAETSSAFNTALIFLYGIVLLTLVITFTYMTEDVISQRTSAEVSFSESQKITVLVTNLYLSIHGLFYTVMTMRLNIYVKEVFSNIWSWINFIALLSSFIVTIRIWHLDNSPANISDKALITLSTIAIGTLWSAIVGYLSKWWYSISCFCSGAVKVRCFRNVSPLISSRNQYYSKRLPLTLQIASYLISPLIVVSVISLAFMQMVYLIHMRDGPNNGQCLYEEQTDANGESIAVCSLWESYKIAYLIIIGEGLLGAETSSGNSIFALLAVFAIVAFILILYTVSLAILNMQQSGIEDTMVETFWLPMLTHVLITQQLKDFFSVGLNFQTMSSRLRDMWDYITISFSDVDIKDTKWWYLQNDPKVSHLIGNKWFVRVVSVFIIPIWFTIGLLSLGILWPPQIRHWIFCIGMKDDNFLKSNVALDHSNLSQMTPLHSDISKMKIMMYDRFQIIEDEIRALNNSINELKEKE
jgi:ankyrin repeat protein